MSGGATGACAPSRESRAGRRTRREAARGHATAYLELAKPGVTALVLLTAAAGFLLAGVETSGPATLVLLLLGTALTCGGTNALNQVTERNADRRMRRTRDRPLPSRRLGTVQAAAFAVGVSLLGLLVLTLAVHPLTGSLAAVTLVLYVGVYTPLKRLTPLSTPVGAIPGALPAVGGWTAATGRIEAGAIALFLILFAWQMPHFLALGWRYREEYRRGGFRILAVADAGGHRSARRALAWTALLVPTAALPAGLGVTGTASAVGAVALGLGFLAAAGGFAARPTAGSARRLFLASVAYLPLLLLLLVVDRAG